MDVQYLASFFGISARFLSELDTKPIPDRSALDERDFQEPPEQPDPMEDSTAAPASALSVIVSDDDILLGPSGDVDEDNDLWEWSGGFRIFTNAKQVAKEVAENANPMDDKCIFVLPDGRYCGLKRYHNFQCHMCYKHWQEQTPRARKLVLCCGCDKPIVRGTFCEKCKKRKQRLNKFEERLQEERQQTDDL